MYNNCCCRTALYVDQQLSWLEQPAHNRLVRGSSPCWSTIYFLCNIVSYLLRNLFIIRFRIKRRLQLAFCDRDFRVKNHPPDNFSRRNCWSTIYLQGYGVNGSTPVSKTVCEGSSPSTPAKSTQATFVVCVLFLCKKDLNGGSEMNN